MAPGCGDSLRTGLSEGNQRQDLPGALFCLVGKALTQGLVSTLKIARLVFDTSSVAKNMLSSVR